jgi:hypothetical protein
MRNRLAAASLVAVASFAACANQAPSALPSAPSATTPTATVAPSVAPSPTPLVGVRAPAGVRTAVVVRGAIYLGFEACVGLAPDGTSPYLPPIGEDDFVVVFPRGWKVVPEHAADPRFGDHFQVFDAIGELVAVDGDVLEINGVVRASAASHCGFGWPMSVRHAKVAGD